MNILPVTAPEFAAYGRLVPDFAPECAALARALLEHTPLPAQLGYVPREPALQELPEADVLGRALFGGMPCQFGWCSGHNTRLNCLEYHRASEYNLGVTDFILLLAKQRQIENGTLDTARVKAFFVPAGALVEIYPDTLHYAPCQASLQQGFRVIAIMPDGANTALDAPPPARGDGRLLWARGKWLLAHPDAPEAAQGAYVGLRGENIDLAAQL